jgi:hypothetical protein
VAGTETTRTVKPPQMELKHRMLVQCSVLLWRNCVV